MNPQDTDRAIAALAQAVDALRDMHKVCSAVESMILLPLIRQTQTDLDTLQQLKAALRETV